MLNSMQQSRRVKMEASLRLAEQEQTRLSREVSEYAEFKGRLEELLNVHALPLSELLVTVQLALTRRDQRFNRDISEERIAALERRVIELTNEVASLRAQPKPAKTDTRPQSLKEAQ